MWSTYGIFLALYRKLFHVTNLGIFLTLYRRMFHLVNVQDISHVIQKNVSCGQLTGYFSRYTEECFMWPTYGLFLTLYRRMFYVASLRDIFHVIQKNALCDHLTGYFLSYTDWRFLWPSYWMFLTVYRIMLRVAIIRNMFSHLSSRIIKVNTMNRNLSTVASPEPQDISLWIARVLCFEHMNPVYIPTTFSFNTSFLRLLYTHPHLFLQNSLVLSLVIKNLSAENLYPLHSEISSSLKCNADSITVQKIY